ncbi:hypothetical protein SprV_0100219800 [Sparganum proliferum]
MSRPSGENGRRSPTKQIFYGDVATGVRRPEGPERRYKDTLKNSLKRLQINPETCEDLVQHRLIWRREVRTDAAIYQANRIAVAIAKREVRKSQAPTIRSIATPFHLRCLHCRRTFRVWIGLVGHLRAPCINHPTTATVVISIAHAPTSTSTTSAPALTKVASNLRAALLSATTTSTISASAAATTSNTTTFATTVNDQNAPDAPTTAHACIVIAPASSDATCNHCDHTFTSNISLAGHLRIHHAKAGEPVPVASAYTRRFRLHCPHCPRTFNHRMGLFGHMDVHKSGINRDIDKPRTSCTPNIPGSPDASSSSASTTKSRTTITDSDAPTYPAHTDPAHSSLTLVWSVTCGSVTETKADQFLEHQHIPDAFASTARTIFAHSATAWAY